MKMSTVKNLNCELNLPLFTIQHNDTNSFLSYYLIKDGMKGFLGSLRQGLQKIFRPVVLISTKNGIGKGNCGVREYDRRGIKTDKRPP